MHNVVIGAGQCGRGYLARLLALSNETFTFIDKNETLILQLNQQTSYQIHFCGSEREAIQIREYHAYSWSDTKSLQAIQEADIIFVSIGEQNLNDLVDPIKKALLHRQKQTKVKLITAENGIAPKAKLIELQDHVELSESVIFCTTLQKDASLDIISEDLDHLPYDRRALLSSLPFHGMVEEMDFKALLERKIYTYNSLSACIAYVGAYKGYTVYSEAANDVDIKRLTFLCKKELDQTIASVYEIPLTKQQDFSTMAIAKFANPEIIDTIDRNVRDVKRKLNMQERILAPMYLIEQQGGNAMCFYLICGAALWYGTRSNTYDISDDAIKKEFVRELQTMVAEPTIETILRLYDACMNHCDLADILREVGL